MSLLDSEVVCVGEGLLEHTAPLLTDLADLVLLVRRHDLEAGLRIKHFFPWIQIRLTWKKNQDPERNEEKNIFIFIYFIYA